ncbi:MULTISPECIES: GTP cyclohydrolase II [unclassified Psychrobacter]|uniref:GTP cyclohydrolase II n=1 Tax=unclassified Psychrobacter TaxID=196806 RepID=UPI0009A673BC|nr:MULTISPECIES: GTP cyclohydrolase II [unclassified Psychrobacter]MDE4454466.1 GTP cyclohydrolase II [Psychrobacter sp. DAB_AL62B]OXL24275.1 GTP cyclohydrolase II [Psychrobacter sp. DAB_AL32B]SLJ83510.1 GTP cyclohydrolase II [Psychrobacter sp. DAB_AL43B]
MSYQFITSAKLPTRHGEFDIHIFENDAGQEHVMLTVGLSVVNDTNIIDTSHPHDAVLNQKNATLSERPVPLIRIHSECLTGDAFSSLKCDCGPQLNTAMQAIQEMGCGAILYLRQEGRGIGLTNKIRAYALQDQGHDTLDANLMLGLPADARIYDMCGPMLAHVGVDAVRLITNNPDKVAYLTEHGIDVVERVPLVVGVNDMNAEYLATKRDRMGHLFDKEFNTALHLNK